MPMVCPSPGLEALVPAKGEELDLPATLRKWASREGLRCNNSNCTRLTMDD